MATPNIGVIPGLGNSGTVNALEQQRDVDPRLFYLDAEKYPLASLIFTMGTELDRSEDGLFTYKGKAGLMSRPTHNPKFEWTEQERLKFEFALTAASNAADTTLDISTSDDEFFVANMEILGVNAAGQREVMRVTTVANGVLTVTRNVGSTGAIVFAAADKIYIMGVLRQEDSVSTDARTSKSETLFNYVSFLSEPYGLTIINQATVTYYGDPYRIQKQLALDRIKQRLEMMFWFGVRDVLTSTTNAIWHNGGIFYWLESQFTDVTISDFGGLMTRQSWEAFLIDAMKRGSRRKVAFCSSPVMNAISGFATNQLRPSDVNLRKFGMNIVEYASPHGSVMLVYEPLFDEIESVNGSVVILDMENVKWRYLAGNGVNLNLKSNDDIQENDRSGRKGEWTVVGGIQISTGKTHAIGKNVNN